MQANKHLSPSYSANEKACNIIEQEINASERAVDELRQKIGGLRSRLNAFVPVSQLPNEILCHIFFQVRTEEAEKLKETYYNGEFMPPSRWISVSYVCSHWRRVATGAPELWTEPLIKNLNCTKTMLGRSKRLPISIKLEFKSNCRPSEHICRVLQECFKPVNINRIKHISIFTYDKDILRTLPSSIPCLETLRISGVLHVAEIPSNSIVVSAKSLRRLELSGAYVNWDSNMFKDLTHLKLHSIFSPKDQTGIASQLTFLDVLRHLAPKLLALDLKFESSPKLLLGIPYTSIPIHFSQLTLLALNLTTPEVHSFFRVFTIPSDTMIKFTGEDNHVYSHFLGHVTHAYTAPRSTLQTLVFDQQSWYRPASLYLYDKVVDWKYGNRGSQEAPLTLYMRSTTLTDTVNDVCNNAGPIVHAITHVHLSILADMTNILLRNVRRLPAVTFISLNKVTDLKILHEFLHALTPDQGAQSGHDSTTIPFPSLTSICFDSVTVRSSSAEEEFVQRFCISSLKNVLIRRKSGGASIQFLSINKWDGIEEVDIDLFKEIVNDVRWVK